MPEIYVMGKGNLIQLGNSDTVELAVQSMNNILDELRDTTDNFKNLHNIGPGANAKKGAAVYSKAPPLASINAQALIELLSHPWFTRLWVIQEAFKAPVNTCYYGQARFPLEDVLRICVWIGYNRGFCPRELIGCFGAKQGPRLWVFLDRQYGTNRDSGF
ncbi:Putative heterokaryon incompatibility [Septoria linicola]|uniref:Heterokaryon incompatibility n=1 Tax=Septoria linicola TaxID=215465 RepID=A0A9Q9AKR8_9PEZI|nr:Putative heterokaryon incompatibility [Septoria linicola]